MKRLHPAQIIIIVLGLTMLASQVFAEAELIERIAAVVNDDTILYSTVKDSALSLQGRLHGITNPEELKRARHEIQMDALNNLIDEKLLEQQIEELKYTVSESEVDQNIQQIMSKNGIPDEATLKAVLARQGIKWSEYREQVAQQIKRWQFISAKVGGKIKISDEDVRLEYEKEVLKKSREFEFHARHILTKVPRSALPEVSMEAKAKMDRIRKKLVDEGQDFADLALQYSDGPTAKHGGDLGWFRAGVTVPEFDEVMRRLKVGEISDVVRTRFGYHIIQLVEKRPIPPEPFEKMAGDIRARLQQEESERQMRAWLQDLRMKSYVKILLDDPPEYPSTFKKKGDQAPIQAEPIEKTE